MLNYNALDMDKEVVGVFEWLLTEQGMSPREALDFLDYDIFVKNSNAFHSLSEAKQTAIRNVIHAINLVHK